MSSFFLDTAVSDVRHLVVGEFSLACVLTLFRLAAACSQSYKPAGNADRVTSHSWDLSDAVSSIVAAGEVLAEPAAIVFEDIDLAATMTLCEPGAGDSNLSAEPQAKAGQPKAKAKAKAKAASKGATGEGKGGKAKAKPSSAKAKRAIA